MVKLMKAVACASLPDGTGKTETSVGGLLKYCVRKMGGAPLQHALNWKSRRGVTGHDAGGGKTERAGHSYQRWGSEYGSTPVTTSRASNVLAAVGVGATEGVGPVGVRFGALTATVEEGVPVPGLVAAALGAEAQPALRKRALVRKDRADRRPQGAAFIAEFDPSRRVEHVTMCLGYPLRINWAQTGPGCGPLRRAPDVGHSAPTAVD